MQLIDPAVGTGGCNIMDKSVAAKNARGASRGHGPSLYAGDGARKYLNAAERVPVLAAADTLDPDKRLFALTLLWTGARVSEVLSLTPSSFQVESAIVAFRTLKRRRHIVREVPIPATLMDALVERYNLNARPSDLSTAQARLWTWRRETVWRFIKKIMEQASVAGRPACPRGLRHGFGVGTLQAGVPLNLVQRWLGHARIATTAIYTEASGPEERAIASRFWELA